MLMEKFEVLNDEQEQSEFYEAPQLIEYGAVEELTQVGGSI